MSKRKTSQARIDANRRNAQKSTGPRTPEGKAQSAQNATTHGFSASKVNSISPASFLNVEDENQFRGMLDEYVATYSPQHPDELDLVTEAVYAKWRQQRLWIAETAQLEIAMAQNANQLQKALPTANAAAHVANAFANSESIMRLYLRYDAQLHRHYKSCLNQLRDLQAARPRMDDSPIEPKPPTAETEIAAVDPIASTPQPEKQPLPNEANVDPSRLLELKTVLRRLLEQQAGVREGI